MKLTDELKKKIENTKTEEEAKAILKDVRDKVEGHGVILEDQELDKAAGGGNHIIRV